MSYNIIINGHAPEDAQASFEESLAELVNDPEYGVSFATFNGRNLLTPKKPELDLTEIANEKHDAAQATPLEGG